MLPQNVEEVLIPLLARAADLGESVKLFGAFNTYLEEHFYAYLEEHFTLLEHFTSPFTGSSSQ